MVLLKIYMYFAKDVYNMEVYVGYIIYSLSLTAKDVRMRTLAFYRYQVSRRMHSKLLAVEKAAPCRQQKYSDHTTK